MFKLSYKIVNVNKAPAAYDAFFPTGLLAEFAPSAAIDTVANTRIQLLISISNINNCNNLCSNNHRNKILGNIFDTILYNM